MVTLTRKHAQQQKQNFDMNTYVGESSAQGRHRQKLLTVAAEENRGWGQPCATHLTFQFGSQRQRT